MLLASIVLIFVLSVVYVEAMTLNIISPGTPHGLNFTIFNNTASRKVNITYNATWSFGDAAGQADLHENRSNCSLWINSTTNVIKWDIAKNITIDSPTEDANISNQTISYVNHTFSADGNYTFAIACYNFTNASVASGLTFSGNRSIYIDTAPPRLVALTPNATLTSNGLWGGSTGNFTGWPITFSVNIFYNRPIGE
ncbi:hypothetical protein HYY71_00910 [Candidatus Woesearchaeota archaeon]|nr:hypothetical protein [Candidatus Woesearchaeota archaeon]